MKKQHNKPIAISVGEPAGIGPDIVIGLAQKMWAAPLLVFANKDLLTSRAISLSLPLSLLDWNTESMVSHVPGSLLIKDIPLQTKVNPGQLDLSNSSYVIAALDAATQSCLDGQTTALVTGPINKGHLNAAGIHFTGHTEHLAQYCGTKKTVMMFTSPEHRIALQTTHLPLRDVADAITREALLETLTILHAALSEQFKINDPKIAVCGLNPHAGENGYLGREEIDIITPVIQHLQKQGMQLTGPFPADTAFIYHHNHRPDAVLSMYHDQALPMLKTSHFNQAVNVTLGLPIIRTSVDHGTALSIAGTGNAHAENICHAVEMAISLAS